MHIIRVFIRVRADADRQAKSGGRMVVPDDAGEFVPLLLNRINNQYVASFPADPAKSHKLHSLEVKSIAKDIELSAPAQYLAP